MGHLRPTTAAQAARHTTIQQSAAATSHMMEKQSGLGYFRSQTDKRALSLYLVKLVKENIDWRALPSDNSVEDLCCIAVLCWPDYGIDELIIQILMVDVDLLKHLQQNVLIMLAVI